MSEVTEMRGNALDSLPARRGHFLLESGYHTDSWLTLDELFCDPAAVATLVDALAEKLRPYGALTVCGPLLGGAFLAQTLATTLGSRFCYAELIRERERGGMFAAEYRLPQALRRSVRGQTVAVVDDAISAGSSVRATIASLADAGATTVVVGALLVLGDAGWNHVTEQGIPVEALERRSFELWEPSACPLCRSGATVEDPRKQI